LLIATALVGQESPPTKVATIEIRGVVYKDDKPVARAVVHAQGSEVHSRFSTSFQQKETTDAKGAFTIKVVPQAKGGEISVRLRARHGQAFTAEGVVVRGEALKQPVRLTISPRHARALSVRIVDEMGQPISGATIIAKFKATPLPPVVSGVHEPVQWPEGTAKGSDREGRFLSPRGLDPDGEYQPHVVARGFLEESTPWKKMEKEDTLAFGDVVLTRSQPLEGVVVDRKGKPVAGAKVVRRDDRLTAESTTDEAGQFRLESTFFPPGFVFVEKEGYRFHGQRCDKADKLRIVLTRRDEPATSKMTSLSWVLPLAKRRELAEQLFAPSLKRVLPKGTDSDRLRLLKTLGRLDPGRLIEELDRRPLGSAWYDGYVRREAVAALRNHFDEACTVAESIKDPGFRSTCYLDLCDARPASNRADRIKCLPQELP
jgi:hypothetical protein